MSSETLNTTGAFSQAKDLKNRIFFTILIFVVYRLGTYVPLSGIDPVALKEIMASSQKDYSVCSTCSLVVLLQEWQFLH